MTQFGYDVSHHQLAFDHDRAYAEGMRFAMVKCTEGEGWRDPLWTQNRDVLLAGKTLFVAYHWLWSGVRTENQAANTADHLGDLEIPVMVDVELRKDGSQILSRPTIEQTMRYVQACANIGVKVTLAYLPEWYWRDYLGSPSLPADFPPIVQSHFVSGATASPEVLYPGDDDFRWQYDVQLDPVILQFTDNARIAGKTPVDADAYRGDLADLTQWFYAPTGFDMGVDLNLEQVVRKATDTEPELKLGQALRMLPKIQDRALKFYTNEAGRDASSDEALEVLAASVEQVAFAQGKTPSDVVDELTARLAR